MITALARKLFSGGARFVRRQQAVVDAVNALEPQLQGLPADQLARKTAELRTRAANGAKPQELVAESFALAREAASQTLGMRHFDVQLLGGLALSQGMIAEMKTGEGKTLVATLPAVHAAVCATPVHVVTVNDYLARRDAEWMGKVYTALGLSVGVNVQGLDLAGKQAAYAADIAYGTNNQFGFDFLNDNMAQEPGNRLQRGLGLAIVDEVDSILIDEARTPLAISGIAGDQSQLYQTCDALARMFEPGVEAEGSISGDFAIDERTRQIHFSDEGYEKAEQVFAERKLLHDGGLYEAHNLNLMHHLVAALRARYLYKRDHEYVVKDKKVVIVDEHTGRLMPGRRWGDGLHQAIEAKEGLPIEPETQTLASISLQNYYRQYQTLAGMTGTALSEADEFAQIYGLEVAEIPTHRDMVRDDGIDRVYANKAAKLRNIVADISDCHSRGQPVLVGTTTIEASEELAGLLSEAKIDHEVLNAKQHEREAQIITQAGMAGRVTIATSMAGRGTDIVLGGNIDAERAQLEAREELDDEARAARLAELERQWQKRHDQVVASGGLRIIGTERHESRRNDNQLRGRAGRQGDPGSSVFYLSFEDPLMRVFADQKIGGMIGNLMGDDDEPLEAGMVARAIAKAQRRVESHNFDIRKQLLEYDDIANDQRQIIYDQRRHIVDAEDIAEIGREFTTATVESVIATFIPLEASEEEWNVAGATAELEKIFKLDFRLAAWLEADDSLAVPELTAKAVELALQALAANLERLGPDSRKYQKTLILGVLDTNWRQHLSGMDHLRMGIGLRGFAQKNPKQEYRREALTMFNSMLETVRRDTAQILMSVKLREPQQQPAAAAQPPAATPAAAPARPQLPPGISRPRRNDPCPCGSGKKFKHCHGRAG